MSEHTWFQDNLAGYCAGGLSTEERERFDRHRIACAACARTLTNSQRFNETMDNLFAGVRPDAGWENRVIETLHVAPRWRGMRWSKWKHLAAGMAALVALGTLGALLNSSVSKGKVTFPGTREEEAPATKYAAQSESHNHRRQLGFGYHPDGRNLGDNVAVGKSEERLAELDDTTRNKPNDFGFETAPSGRPTTGLGLPAGDLVRGGSPPVSESKLTDSTMLGRQEVEGLDTYSAIRSPAVKDGVILNQKSDRLRVLALPPALSKTEGPPAKNGSPYFTPPLTVAKSADSPSEKKIEDEKARSGSRARGFSQLGEKASREKTEATKESAQPTSPPNEAAPRKIIRTGEIEFEVDGFDAAVAGITRLVNGVAGAFVTTVNSDKLPNGKVKGSLVVRLPPEKLDKFLLDVRHELTKTGELKSQRIGSQDVTKQYTDVESRLRGARAMEERFLQIIKTGKGEIKDLIAAENALGVWRTKIEEMEGEIRYYNNQVGLSTLTITLYEKEIQAPAALVVTERVKMQLEVEDVEKAQKTALAAVADAKGRVTKSELKQHAAGQLEAILYFEVAPDLADKVKNRLKELGIVTHQDAERSQQAQGTGSRADIKIKQGDVRFEVGMYNVANVQPREVLVIQIASLDVPASFRKLQEAVAKAQGQVRTGQLNEQDKLNVSAQFDFDIPTVEKKTLDQALGEVGKVVSRSATQAAPGEAATDRKVGYRLTLRNVAALPSREKVSLGIEVKDVDQTVAEILDMIKIRQGYIAGAQMNHERTGRVSAILVFDVPLSAKDELIRQVKSAGILRLQTSTRNPQAPDNELATAHIDVTITSSGPIVPSDEGLWPQIRTSLFYSFKLLSWSLTFVILGLSVVLPWLLVLWVGYKLVSKWRKRPAAGPAA
jgi:hypothetical protein